MRIVAPEHTGDSPSTDLPELQGCGIEARWWGKAGGNDGWHPVQAHCLDVAAVGFMLLSKLPWLEARLCNSFGMSVEQASRWVGFWLSLHDLGKFAESFQSQRRDLFHLLRGREPNPAKSYTVRHDSLGMMFWSDVVRTEWTETYFFGPGTGDIADGLDFWVRASTGHHGQPPLSSGFWADHFHPIEDRSAAQMHVATMRAMFLHDDLRKLIESLDPQVFAERSQELSWWMAGLAVLADWLGSNTSFFPYLDSSRPAPTIGDYWRVACAQAEAAIAASGVLPPAPAAPMHFSELFPGLSEMSPLQHWSALTPLAEGPQLHCLEDVTGAGKTEAALMLTHRLMASGRACGFFVALPTMATANAMYARVAAAYRRLFDDPTSLVLATSSRDFVDQFAASIVEHHAARVLPHDTAEPDVAQQDDTASARCAAWLADHRKRALLSPAGVGTIDQALLAVLHSKHQSLRLLGLMQKVLVVDEVHACDDYMLRVLGVLLEFHARAGGSVVLLSATLPQRAKQSLLSAYARGLGLAAPKGRSNAYPLATSWPAAAQPLELVQEEAIDTRSDVRRTVSVVLHERQGSAVALVREALARGQCVCWVRNTVADALEAYSLFENELLADCLWLFHARFALHDRLAMEKRVLDHFGKAGGPSERAGRLLIATQVVEQSLDVDFDVLISDLAPIDRLVQRAGRLRRHRRLADGAMQPDPVAADARGEPVLHVLCPPWADSPAKDWFKATSPKGAAVYPNHAQLWLTMKALRAGHFTMPDDARQLIEGVFGDDVEVPAGLQENSQAAEGQSYAAQSQAMMNTLALRNGYSRTQTQGADWWTDAHTPSRLGEATHTVALARWDGTQLRPWVDASSNAWAYSSLRMSARSIAAEVEAEDHALKAAVEAVKQELPAQGRWTVLLPLRHTPQCWTGHALAPASRGRPAAARAWRYDTHRGLQPVSTDAEPSGPNNIMEEPDA